MRRENLLLGKVVLPPLQEPHERVKAALQRQLPQQVPSGVPLARRVGCVPPLLQLLRDGRHPDVHPVQRGYAVLVVDVDVDGQPAADEGRTCRVTYFVGVVAPEHKAVPGERVYRRGVHLRVVVPPDASEIISEDENDVGLQGPRPGRFSDGFTRQRKAHRHPDPTHLCVCVCVNRVFVSGLTGLTRYLEWCSEQAYCTRCSCSSSVLR